MSIPTYGELGQEIVKLQEKIQDIQNKISVERENANRQEGG